MRRRLLAFRFRIRDLGLIALAVQHFWSGLSGWISLSAGLALAAVVMTAMATAATTHAKAVSTEQRLSAYITQTDTTVTGYDTRLNRLETGTFSNVPGAGTVTMTAASAGPYSLHVGALANLTGGPNTAFLATLSQCGPQSDAGGNDGNTGGTWATGERGFVNNAINAINSVRSSLINHGFMHP